MKGSGILRMKTENSASILNSDMTEFKIAAQKLAMDAIKLGSVGIGTDILQWIASIAAIYLLVLDRTNWKTNMLTGLLVPYIFFSLPSLVFNIVRGQIGRWIAFVVIIVRAFFPKHYPDWAELPAAMIMIIVVAPDLLADTLRDSWSWIGALVCLVIASYLLQEHIRASGGFRNSFTKANGVSNTVGILFLLAYGICGVVFYFI